ncbi:glycosyltransferase family 2 protein [Palleronia sp. KMU-117]|uniref:glycosyltransferase family 2 protein n=1 Tax=Palleronia sp. KMU-117 TaxID=3434108 RepID=UPI003D73A586
MTHPFTALDDLKVVSSRQPDPEAMTLCAVGRNEMYFLPAFLEHYRKLGIEQFAILNDRSTDGTTEYLLAQPDVVVFESRYRYGDEVDLPADMVDKMPNGRILYIWRTIFYARFAKTRWAVQTDLDEFIHLPPGASFQDVARRLDDSGASVAYGVMLDVYPETLSDLAAMADQKQIDPGAKWYFDAEPHLELRAGELPRTLHPGARARLYKTFGTTRLYQKLGVPVPVYRTWLKRMRRTRFGTKIPAYNTIHKPVMAKWPDGAYFTSSHNTSIDASDRFLLPFQHYRFTGALYAKIDMAIRENSYSAGSRDHHLLSDLLQQMQAQPDATFLYRNSRLLNGFDDLRKAGVAIGL